MVPACKLYMAAWLLFNDPAICIFVLQAVPWGHCYFQTSMNTFVQPVAKHTLSL